MPMLAVWLWRAAGAYAPGYLCECSLYYCVDLARMLHTYVLSHLSPRNWIAVDCVMMDTAC